jgi:ubiquitin-protein ligase
MQQKSHLTHSRLTRDAAELFTADFTCSASQVLISQTTESLNESGSITIEIFVFEGPYRGGKFTFCFQIPSNYPFKALEIWSTHPIWHPNVDLSTGKMHIPLDWSPVLTLTSFARAAQVIIVKNFKILFEKFLIFSIFFLFLFLFIYF